LLVIDLFLISQCAV